MEWFLFLYFVFHLLLRFPSYTYSLCNPHDNFALLQFKNSFPLSTSKTDSWKNGTDCCQWDGITCDTMSGHVIGLDLSCSNLEGEFHPNSTIYQLRHLQQLNLAFNRFSGSPIYHGIGDLVNLTHLNLSHSAITVSGDIPSTISHLSKLVSLDLGDLEMRLDPSTWNKLILNATNLREIVLDDADMSSITGSSLSLLRNLSTSLVSLNLAQTQLQGDFPCDILSFPNLQDLTLSDNPTLKGQLPKSNWSISLRYLNLQHTAFFGEIPNSLGHLTSLIDLNLAECKFDGLVPSSLFDLPQLSSLVIYSNNLVGPIPGKITNLSKLNSLLLSHNKLNGTIPDWCYSLPSLLALYLNDNQLTGSVSEFSTYSLEYLFLSNNILLRGNFPHSIFKFENLTKLGIASTELSGLVDFHKFSKLKNIVWLDLSHNSFLSINIDSSIDYILPNLAVLHLSSCNISTFPKFLAHLNHLEALDLSHNKIHGKTPKWFHEVLSDSWKDISYIDLSFNNLEGDLPIPSYGIRYIIVSNNNFAGDISSTICNFSSLEVLDLAYNNLTGTIPQCLGALPSLSVLDLRMNRLHGSMPANFSKENAFLAISLNNNKLEGRLPQSLAHCTELQVLDLADNNIEDIFPSWLETLQELQIVILRSNKFHGAITCFNSSKPPFPKLRVFDVSDNNFSGPLPASCIKNFQGMINVSKNGQTGPKYMDFIWMYEFGSYNYSVVIITKSLHMQMERIPIALSTIDLSNNMFEGEIPKVIGQLNALVGLNLSHNRIKGTIPQSLSNLRNLESLDLSRNRLRGEIPMALTNLNFLAFLNLSQNQFMGIIPTGKQFDTFGNESYGGNPKLCGLPLSKPCNKDGIGEQPPNSATTDHAESGFGWKAVAVGYACGMVFGMLLGFNVFFTGKPQWLARQVESMFNIRLRRTINRTRANRSGRN